MKLTRSILCKNFAISEATLEELQQAIKDSLLQNLDLVEWPAGIDPEISVVITIQPHQPTEFAEECNG